MERAIYGIGPFLCNNNLRKNRFSLESRLKQPVSRAQLLPHIAYGGPQKGPSNAQKMTPSNPMSKRKMKKNEKK